jgi:hypothetical protein
MVNSLLHFDWSPGTGAIFVQSVIIESLATYVYEQTNRVEIVLFNAKM